MIFFRDEFADLNCKIAVVVGGDDGIGYAAAHNILSQKAKVVGIFGRNICRGMEACYALNCRFGKRKAVFFKVDVTSKNDIDCKYVFFHGETKVVKAN